MAQTRRSFDLQLAELRQRVTDMGYYVVDMLEQAMEAVLQCDMNLAEKVVQMDDEADEMDLDIENMCLKLLALQQPLGRDLRLIATALKVISDLERIGDYAEDIAKITPIMVEHPVPELLSEIPTLGHMATDMIRNAVKSFVDSDIELAHQVCRDDRPVDRLYRQILKQVVNFLSEQPQAAYPGVYVVLLARRLERTADHATNIAERVHYMVTGKLVQLARVYREEESTLPFGEQ